MDVSLRLRFLRPGKAFGVICTSDQVAKFERVVVNNGGALRIEKTQMDGVFILIYKTGDETKGLG
jgi:hypothetical protein